MAELQMEGWAELRPKLLELPDKMVNNILRASLRQAANVVRDEAKERAPVLTGALRDSVRTVARRGSRDRVQFNIVAGSTLTATQQERHGITAPFYALFVEYGHGGPRAAPPHPFMRPALEATAGLALDFVMTGISDRLESLVA